MLLLTNLNAVSPRVSSMSKNSRRKNLSLLQPCQQYATVSTRAHATTGHSNVISRTICKCVSYLEVTGDAAAVKHNLTEESYIRAGYVNCDTDVARLDCDVTHCNSYMIVAPTRSKFCTAGVTNSTQTTDVGSTGDVITGTSCRLIQSEASLTRIINGL